MSCRQDLGIAEPKIVVWAHNSHVGDARFTDMGRKRGEVNVGQLMRERYGEPDVRLPAGSAVASVDGQCRALHAPTMFRHRNIPR